MGPHSCPTVAIQGESSEGNPSGVVIINESDFDPETMTKCKVPEPSEPAAPEPAAPVVDPNAQKEPPKVVAPWAA